jgi:ATP-binding cassette subfamily D (ALD) protein 3
VLFSKKLAELLGWEGPITIIMWYLISGVVIRIISPTFGRLVAKE